MVYELYDAIWVIWWYMSYMMLYELYDVPIFKKLWIDCTLNIRQVVFIGYSVSWLLFYYSYIRHGSYPLATPYNETYPANFHVKKSHFLQLTTNNISFPYPIQTPRPGPWFLAGFLPRKENKVTQAVWSYKQGSTLRFVSGSLLCL